MENCTLRGNFAGLEGGGAYFSNTSAQISNCTFDSNSATEAGGGIFAQNLQFLTVDQGTLFSGNTAVGMVFFLSFFIHY
jgi:predicted outer membrane repeat protein